uniref:Uncharacterized protein n=1 Tax=Parascaris univalens TaxID=6257 RepID=A0A915B0U6_PARUN
MSLEMEGGARQISEICPGKEGKALEAVGGFIVAPENYEAVKTTLQQRFGRSEVLLKSLYAELRDAATPTKDFEECVASVERILQQLELQGENINNSQTELCIEKRLPRWSLLEVEQAKEADAAWSVRKLIDKLQTIVRIRENMRAATKGNRRMRVGKFKSSEPHWADICPRFTILKERLDRQLGIEVTHKEPLIVDGFGGTRTTHCTSARVKLKMKRTDGRLFTMFANSVPRLVNEIAIAKLTEKTLRRIRSTRNITLPTVTLKPQILVGADYFHEIFRGSASTELSSGFHLIRTCLGDMISG